MDGNSERLLTPGEVAALFRVDPKTVTRRKQPLTIAVHPRQPLLISMGEPVLGVATLISMGACPKCCDKNGFSP